jgi:hypothetical protein
MPNHVCKNNDHISKIAADNGFKSWHTIWDVNKDSVKRVDPNLLFKGGRLATGGDTLKIPDKAVEGEFKGVDAKHIFKILQEKLMLRMRILKDDFTPLKKAPYELKVDSGATLSGKTDDNGALQHEIPNNASVAVLTVRAKAADTDTKPPPPPPNPAPPPELRGDVPITWTLKIGALNPVREQAPDNLCISGVQQRLNNLNMNTGPIDGILGPNTKAAVKAFQDLYGIKKSKDQEGVPDADQTQDMLWKVHDGPSPAPTPPPPPPPAK